jgi:hypothetical protein
MVDVMCQTSPIVGRGDMESGADGADSAGAGGELSAVQSPSLGVQLALMFCVTSQNVHMYVALFTANGTADR